MRKTIEEAQELIDTVARNQHLYLSSESSMKEEAKTVTAELSPAEQVTEFNQQLDFLTKQLAEFKEILQDTRMANMNMEVQLKQTEQQLSKQITEECQAVQLRSGKTLNTSLQSSRKPRNEQMSTQNPSEDNQSPERNDAGAERPDHAHSWRSTPETSMDLALNAQKKHGSGVQTPETSREVVFNATPASTPGIQMPVGDQSHISADNNPSKKAS